MKPDFAKYTDGLVPAIIQDNNTGKVLMLGYMNEIAYDRTIDEKQVVFFSRSRQELWKKGETSGNYLDLVTIFPDCDNDCLLIKAVPAGPVCHTGADTCFDETNHPYHFLIQLEKIITDRKEHPGSGSYTSSLFERGINAMAQKVGEEAVELIIEAKDNNADKFINEAADLLFHYLVLLQAKDASVAEVIDILKERHQIRTAKKD